jgi:hypothetical protein
LSSDVSQVRPAIWQADYAPFSNSAKGIGVLRISARATNNGRPMQSAEQTYKESEFS